jgi:hypothetical protein
MKIRYSILFLATLVLSGCAQTAKSEPVTNTSAPADPVGAAVVTQGTATIKDTEVITQTEATNKIDTICFRNSEQTRLLINSPQGYCLQYPVGYDIAIDSEIAIMLMKRSVLNPEDPKLIINVEPAGGRTVEQVADQLVADYSVPGLDVKRTPLVIDQEQAIRLDGLTGESINRQVVVVHNDRLYHLTFIPMQGSSDVNAQAEALYNTVIQSFNFRPDTNLCTDCPPPSETP